MKRTLLLFFALWMSALSGFSQSDQPLRVYIRGGEKTHSAGQHDHPLFVLEWREMLRQRGIACEGSMLFPSEAQLDNADVMVMYAPDGGIITAKERERLDKFLKRGGGLVVIHDAVCGDDAQWFKTIIGGAWEHKHSKYYEGDVALYFLDTEHPITRGISNFDLNDEIYYDLHMMPEARVLASAYKPDERNSHDGKIHPSVYDIAPQMWVYEKDNYRAFVTLQGHNHKTFSLPHFRALLLRAIAWTGKRDVDSLLNQEELASLRYPVGGPTAPEESADKITVHPDFSIQLVAAEPLIEKPIAQDWDAQGRLWVAETPEYPAGRRGGKAGAEIIEQRPTRDRISYLEDTNGDGLMDKKTVFADGLELITGFVFHRDGVIVAQAPDIFWLRDTDGDGKADKKELLYTGFGTRDTHAVMSNLRWGMDGWVYMTIGYSGGQVKSADGKKDFGNVGSGVLRFRPDGSDLEQFCSKNGNTWGLDFRWDGELFFSQANGNHINHVVIPERILAAGKSGSATSHKNIEDHKKTLPIRSYDKQAYVQIDHVGGFTAASGAALYHGGAWPENWDGAFFVSEPTVNLVHHDVLKADGVTFVASKDREAEFIAGVDLWFRPVDQRVGPDGAMYLLDFYNQAVVHNDTRGPVHGPANAAVRPDRDHHFGRIWRVQHKQAKPLPMPNLAQASPVELAAALEHPNNWVRMTAHRLLEERQAHDAAPALEQLLISQKPASARVHALWVLAKLGRVNDEKLSDIAESPEPALVRNAMQIAAEKYTSGRFPPFMRVAIINWLKKETDPRSRLAALVALESMPFDKKITEAIVEAYPKLADSWSQAAAHAVSTKKPADFIESAIYATNIVSGLEPLVTFAAGHIASKSDLGQMVTAFIHVCLGPDSSGGLKEIVLDKFVREMKPEDAPPWSPILENFIQKSLVDANPRLPAAALPLIVRWDKEGVFSGQTRGLMTHLAEVALNEGMPDAERLLAVNSLLALHHKNPEILSMMVQIFISTKNEALQRHLGDRLGEIPDAALKLVDAYPTLKTNLQEAIFTQLLKRPESTQYFLDAIVTGKIDLSTFTPLQVSRLVNHSNKRVAERAQKVVDQIRGPQSREKDEIITKLMPVLEERANFHVGRDLFQYQCAVCHRFNGEGQDVGPDLTGMGAHSALELLAHIVDPNRVVEPNFSTVSIETKDGESHDGIVSRENANSVVLRNASGDVEIKKSDIKTRKATGRSLMPEGFEGLGAGAIRDLIFFIRESENKYRILNLKPAFTANSTQGLYRDSKDANESLAFKKFGVTKVEGVPFEIINPKLVTAGKNVIVLRGGSGFANSLPSRATIPNINLKAVKLHFLGGVAGGADNNLPAAKITVHYEDEKTEEFTLHNGRDIADYTSSADVPGSKAASGLLERGQLRWFSRDVRGDAAIGSITIESFNNAVAPVFVAVTAEVIPQKFTVETIDDLKTFFPINFGHIRVSMLGGGTSHDFKKWFNETDSVTLAYSTSAPVNYTEQLDYFLKDIHEKDVLYLCNNQPITNDVLRKAIFDFADKGGGLMLIHPALWYNWKDWPEYNRVLVGGGTRKHDPYGEIEVVIDDRSHPIMQNIPRSFKVKDELYHFLPDPEGTPIEVLATGKNPATGASYPVVWIVKHPKARIFCTSLGHDGDTHENIAFRVMLQNGMAWAAGKK